MFALMRDFTDTMYNPERPPGVDHFTGTDLMVAACGKSIGVLPSAALISQVKRHFIFVRINAEMKSDLRISRPQFRSK